MILPWAHRLISAGAHGLRRIPGQSVNLAHLIWRTPRAPAPLQGAPPVVFQMGLWVLGGKEERAALAAHVTAYRCAASAARSFRRAPARRPPNPRPSTYRSTPMGEGRNNGHRGKPAKASASQSV